MPDLSELEMRILSELEEFGSENIPTLMNAVMQPEGRGQELARIQEAVRTLVNEGLVTIQMSSIPAGIVALSTPEALSEIDGLLSHLQFIKSEKYWTDDRMKGPPFFQIPVPELARTEAGLQAGIRVLEDRGYQWWRSDQ